MSKIESYLTLEKELLPYVKMMGQAADVIINEDVSKYPILVAHQQELTMGIPIFEKDKQGGKWNIHASSLEEFVTKNIILTDKIDEFITAYKNTIDHVCVFVLSELGANFIYLPKH